LAEHVGQTDSIETVIAGADCVVLPSYYREGVPRSLLEAAASARPVITTDATGCREAVIDGETGYLCQPRDVDSLVDAMARVLALTPGEREAMGQAGRTYMERRFAESNVLEAYETALAECI
jgi:glycosyltransferase involved in cell wall biosynthesis